MRWAKRRRTSPRSRPRRWSSFRPANPSSSRQPVQGRASRHPASTDRRASGCRAKKLVLPCPGLPHRTRQEAGAQNPPPRERHPQCHSLPLQQCPYRVDQQQDQAGHPACLRVPKYRQFDRHGDAGLLTCTGTSAESPAAEACSDLMLFELPTLMHEEPKNPMMGCQRGCIQNSGLVD